MCGGEVSAWHRSGVSNERGLSRIGVLRNIYRVSVWLGTGELDDLPPLLGIVDDELAEIGGRAGKHRATEIGKPRLQLGIGERGVDLRIEFRDDVRRRVFGRAETGPLARLETRQEF